MLQPFFLQEKAEHQDPKLTLEEIEKIIERDEKDLEVLKPKVPESETQKQPEEKLLFEHLHEREKEL